MGENFIISGSGEGELMGNDLWISLCHSRATTSVLCPGSHPLCRPSPLLGGYLCPLLLQFLLLYWLLPEQSHEQSPYIPSVETLENFSAVSRLWGTSIHVVDTSLRRRWTVDGGSRLCLRPWRKNQHGAEIRLSFSSLTLSTILS